VGGILAGLVGSYFSPIVTEGLVLNLDASNPASYPGSGSTWFDLSGNSRNFSIRGSGVSWNSSGYFNVNSESSNAFTGPASNSFGFGDEHYVEVVASPLSYTSSVFFRVEATPSTGSDTRAISLHLPWSDQVIYYDTFGCCSSTQRINVSGQVNLNQIKHYSFITRRSSTPNREVYKNNSSIVNSGGNGTATSTWNITTPAVLANTWNGNLYSIRVYNRALTNEERLQNYNYDQARFSIT
jgi:hypothetical protein